VTASWRASRAEPVPGSQLRGLLLSAALGGGVALALALLSMIESWHRGHG
jgi:hypothetical protein